MQPESWNTAWAIEYVCLLSKLWRRMLLYVVRVGSHEDSRLASCMHVGCTVALSHVGRTTQAQLLFCCLFIIITIMMMITPFSLQFTVSD